MTWGAVLSLAVRSLLRRPGRTTLTVIGVVLGSALLVALATVSQIADSRVLSYIGKGGPASAIEVSAAEPGPTALDSDNPDPGAPRPLLPGVLAQIQGAPGVDSVTPVLASAVQASALNVPDSTGRLAAVGATPPFRLPSFGETVVGVDMHRIGNVPISLVAGRLPRAGSTTEVAVTRGYLDRIKVPTAHPEWVLGSEFELVVVQPRPDGVGRPRAARVAVVGVVEQQLGEGQFVAPVELTTSMQRWVLGSSDTAVRLGDPLPSRLVVIASGIDQVHGVRLAITQIGFNTQAPEHLITTVQKYLHVVDIVLGAIGVVGLVIAVLGIGNVLLAAVRERRQQIGVLKAIGARDLDIVRWFASEALLIGATGGLIGTVLGLAGAYAVGVAVNNYLVAQALAGIDFGGVPVTTVLAGVAGSVALSLVAAAIPALIAARLPARESLNAQ